MTDFSLQQQCKPIAKQNPLLLDDPSSFWLVAEGGLDVFCVPVNTAGEVLAQGIHCFRMEAGEVVLGCQPTQATGGKIFALRGYSLADTQLTQGQTVSLLRRDFDLSVVASIDRWVQKLDICLSYWSPSPAQYHLLEADPDVPYAQGTSLSSHYGSVVWVRATDSELHYGKLPIAAGTLTPVTHRSTRRLQRAATVSACYTPQLLSDKNIEATQVVCNYRNFFMQALAFYSGQRSLHNVHSQRRYKRDSTYQLQRTHSLLGKTLGTHIPETSTPARKEEPLIRAIAKALSDWNMDLPAYDARVVQRGNPKETLAHLGVGARLVKLADWDLRRENCGHILYIISDGTYRLLLPPTHLRRSYHRYNPHTGVDEKMPATEKLPEKGLMLYPPLGTHIKTPLHLIKYALRGKRRELIKFFALALLNGVFFLVFPFLVSKMLVAWIPYREWGIFVTSLLGLSLTLFASVAIYLCNATLYIAIKGHVFTWIQSGLWQRMLSLPVSFFRRHSVGEIIDRANAMNIVDKFLNVSIAQSLSALISALVSLVLLFVFNVWFAALIWMIVAVVLAVDYFLLKEYVRLQLRANIEQYEINNFVLQIVNAMAKLRVAHRETFALRQWTERVSRKASINFKASMFNATHLSLHTYFFYYTHMALFAVIIWFMQQDSSGAEANIEDFLIFSAALMQTSFALVQAAMLSTVALSVVPYVSKTKTIITAEGEDDRRGVRLYNLRGRIEFSGVHFAYPDKGGHRRAALHDISFTINPGEYVAVVGPSGSGKSTLVRLLLGFEHPRRGALYIDDHDLDTLNLAVLRQQMGVVLQSNQIVPASVMKNISLGFEAQENYDLRTLYRRSWAAARQAGIAEDIKKFPMSMDSWLGTGQGLSGGQKQRLLIARALSKRPRIMILDEATSAMDNVTQRDIKLMLDNLNVTRVIIAHRLSTIADVNRVIMMKKGRIVEQGSVRGLLNAGGEFSRFAQRQMI